jgi:hypothetical protein
MHRRSNSPITTSIAPKPEANLPDLCRDLEYMLLLTTVAG